MTSNLAPVKALHTSINMLRKPYRRNLPDDYKIYDYFSNTQEKQHNSGEKQDHFCAFQTDADILFDTFLENYNRYKNKEITTDMDKELEMFGAPRVAQYKAFSDLVSFFEDGELEFLNQKNYYYYDLTKKNKQSKNAMFEFVENIVNFDFEKQKKKVVLASGSFFSRHPQMRDEMVRLFQGLAGKGVKIEVNMNCKKSEVAETHGDFVEQVKKQSKFGLDKRIAIHFIKAGNDYFFIEFPHTEKTIIRLNMFLDLNTIKYKKGKTKADVEHFFDNLIQKAKE
jgi:hypothetical protein